MWSFSDRHWAPGLMAACSGANYRGAAIQEKVRGWIQGPAPNCTDKTACYYIFEQWAGLGDGGYLASR